MRKAYTRKELEHRYKGYDFDIYCIDGKLKDDKKYIVTSIVGGAGNTRPIVEVEELSI